MGFVQELLTRPFQVTLFSDVPLPVEWAAHPQVRAVVSNKRGLWWHLDIAKQLRRMPEINLYLSPTSYVVPFLLGRSRPYAVVVHDLIAFRDEPHDRKARFIERVTLRRAVMCASHVFVISSATKHDLLKRFPRLSSSHLTVVFAGPMRVHPERHQGDRKTILCVGTLCPRKNQERLIGAYALLPPQLKAKYDLVLAGVRGWNDDVIVRLAEHTDGVSWAKYVTDEQYEDLLTHCAIFALPSLYEGFGMQILDALQRGMPVLTSGEGSLEEVAGDAALLVDPWNIESIAKGLERLLTDAGLREALRVRGPEQAKVFTWKRSVDLFVTGMEN